MYKSASGYRPRELDLSPFGQGFVSAVAGQREPTTIDREVAAIERREADIRRATGAAPQERPARTLRSRLTRRRPGR